MGYQQTMQVLNGVRAAASSLAKICARTRDLQEQELLVLGVRGSDLLSACEYTIFDLKEAIPLSGLA